ncbi:MAG: succinate-semialdehyde dehydrogenase [[Candidatus Thermochlorobacteriaceae] bacterium GBChlB]|nr:MAG: succinate-semialdehyde dehydrogenase [[Candidatus Thermochlorobacteriaceae] bacterium GBChlB]
MLVSINPVTGETIGSYAAHSDADLEKNVCNSRDAQRRWRDMTFPERALCMRAAAEILRREVAKFADLITLEMGKPLLQSFAELDKCAATCDFFAENAEKFLQPEFIDADASKSYVALEPLGTVLAVMPWNFPFWQVFRVAAPTLMAGNALLVKHAPNTTGCAIAIEKIFTDAGFPNGLVQMLFIDADRVPEKISMLIDHRVVRAVTLTGSLRAGKFVAEKAGAAIKKSVLELGGSDAYLVLDDADLDLASETCVNSRCINTGQSCISAKRFIVVESRRKEFEELVVAKMAAKVVGNPMDDGVDLSALARMDLRETLHAQVKQSIEKGATLLLGGTVPDGNGAFYPATVLANVERGMAAYHEELFGPVAAILSAKNDAHAIELANDTAYGLGAAIFTNDLQRGEAVARQLEVGNCFINTLVRSDARLPFGGVKESGYGRELSHYGIKEFVNVKSVLIR